MSNPSETHKEPHTFKAKQQITEDQKLEGDEDRESFSYAMQLANSVVLPMALQTAMELEVFDEMSKRGPGAKLSAKDIATQISRKNPEAPTLLDRILRLLASHSVIDSFVVADNENEGVGSFLRLYSLNPVSKYFVRNEDGVSLGPLLALIQDKVFLQTWSKLKEAVVEGGIPFNRVYGMHAFEYPRLDPRFNQVFNTAMTNYTTLVVHNILKSYKGFEHLKTLVDVGGGLGVTLNLIISKYPHIHGVNFDLPHVIEAAPSYPGVEHVGGDMLQNVPQGDAIFMKSILHDWSDEQCLKLLKHCYNAVPEDGKLIVVEAVLPIMPETSSTVKHICYGDVLMMTQNPGGRERNEQELINLAVRSGFSGIRFDSFVCDQWVMEFFK